MFQQTRYSGYELHDAHFALQGKCRGLQGLPQSFIEIPASKSHGRIAFLQTMWPVRHKCGSQEASRSQGTKIQTNVEHQQFLNFLNIFRQFSVRSFCWCANIARGIFPRPQCPSTSRAAPTALTSAPSAWNGSRGFWFQSVSKLWTFV